MKSLLPLVFLLLLLPAYHMSSQVFFNINEEWNTQNSTTNSFDRVDSQINSSGGVVTVGSEVVLNEGSNALIQYIDNIGTLQWEISYDHLGFDDYASAVYVDNQDTIYVSGASYDPVSENFDFLVLKISPDGQLVSASNIDFGNGSNNYATDLVVLNGMIYVTGTVENSVTDYDILTICIDGDQEVVWSAAYGSTSNFDLAANIGLVPGGLTVTGGSGTAFDNWQFVAVRYDLNGNETSSSLISNGASQFSTPSSMITHEDGGVTVLGQVEGSQGDLDIALIRLNDNLTTVWQFDYDYQGNDDVGTSFVVDSDGNYTISGWFSEATGQVKLALLNVSSTGNLQWSRAIAAGTGITENLKGMAISLFLGEYYIGGVLETSEGQKVVVYKVKSDGSVVWSWAGNLSNSFIVSSIDVADSTTVKVSGLAYEEGYSKFLTFELKTLRRSFELSTDNGANHAKNQLIVRIRPQFIDSMFVYNRNKVYDDMSKILTPAGLSKFELCLGRTMKDYKGVKVYKNLTPLNQHSLTRQGDTIPIPDFWTSIVVLLDSTFNLDSTIAQLNACNEVVQLAQKNLMYEINDCSTMEYLTSENDDYGWRLAEQDNQFAQQTSINTVDFQNLQGAQGNTDTDGNGYADGNVEVIDAWCYSAGRNDIVVGIIDDKVDFTHEDLRDEEHGYIISGWDFFQNSVINEQTLVGAEWHGTRVAGVIGALRNNGLGVVGIAGGDYRALEEDYLIDTPSAPLSTEIQLGVQMNAYSVGQGITIFSEQAAEAILMAVTNDFEQNWGDACHILNNSWGTTAGGLAHPWRLMEDYDYEIAKNYWFANRNGVANFTARGNRNSGLGQDQSVDRVVYPSCFYDHWLISVGASGDNGQATEGSLNGFDLDVLGPETTSLAWQVFTTTLDFGQSTPYQPFSGTSSGTPHAAGIGALMLSYHNQPFASPENLYPSDVEHLLQMAARNYETQGAYSDEHGWGTVKATQTLELLESPNYQLIHFDALFTNSDLELVGANETVHVPVVPGENLSIDEGIYVVDRYKIEETVSFTTPENYIATSSWSLPEKTNCFLNLHPSGGNQFLFLDEFSEVSDQSSLGNSLVTLKAFVYHIISDNQGNPIDVWFPSASEYHIPYSVHFTDNTPVPVEETILPEVTIFPNPFNDIINIHGLGSGQASRYEVFGVDGAIVKVGLSSGTVDLGQLSRGLYIIRLEANGTFITKKIMKQ